jgi:hypothetical protein
LEKNENNQQLMSDPLRNRIQQWEKSPPPGAWQNIAMELGELNAEKRISEKVLALETSPPVSTWEAIQEQLLPESREAKKRAIVVPIRPLYPYLFRYGAVAIMIGLIAWIFMDSPFSQDPEKITTSIVPAETSATVPGNASGTASTEKTIVTENSDGSIPEAAPDEPVKEAAFRDKTKRDPVHSKVAKLAAEIRDPEYIQKMLDNSLSRSNNPGLSAMPEMQVLPVQNKDPRYISISNEKGEIIRLSAKFAPLYHAFFQHQENLQNNPAYDMMNRLQQQIIRQPFTPGPDNMFDLLRLRDLLEKEQ